MNNGIEFVYFDIGNILLEFDSNIACENLGRILDASGEQVHAALYERGIQDQFEHGELSPADFAALVRSHFGSDATGVSTAEILDAVSDMFTPIESMRGILQSVRSRGYRVGLLSNTCAAHWDWIVRQQYAVMDVPFESTVLSFEIGAMKPADNIYQAAEDAADVLADRILFLDDQPENVRAARHRGWSAVQCFGGDQAIRVLRDHRVLGESS